MNILLVAINAKYIHSNLAVYSLRAYAKELKQHIQIVEYTINHRSDDILKALYQKKPDVICFSCYIWNISLIKELIQEFHQLLPQVPIWLGGPEVTYEGRDLLDKLAMVTGIMVGEGEATFKDLCSYYIGDKTSPRTLSGIPGLLYKESVGIIETVAREPLDLDEIPFCYEDVTEFSNRIMYYESSRGCPFRCSYCLSSIVKEVRFRSIRQIQQELLFFLDNKVKQVKFIDRTFNCNPIANIAIWQFIKEKDNGITNFHFEISADLLNEKELTFLKTLRPGLIQFEIGVQSTNQATIQEVSRMMNVKRLKNAVKTLNRGRNIHQHLDLIAGLPMEGFESFAHSFDQIYQLHPQQLQLGFLKVLKGSAIYEKQNQYELLSHVHPPYEVLSTKWLSYDELLQIKLVEEMLNVYFNSGQFELTLRLIAQKFISPFQFFLDLGTYYEEQGLLSLAHSRMRRSEILLEFLINHDREHQNMYQEALTFDLYLRENMKSRPLWAPEPTAFKNQAKRYYPNAKKTLNYHVEPFFHDFISLLQSESGYPLNKKEWEFYRFSYDERDVLTGQAKVEKCTI